MTAEFWFATTESQHLAVIPLKVPHAEMRNVMGPGLKELMTTVASQGLHPVGPWFTHHFHFQPGIFDFEISVPVEKPITAAGRVVPRVLPAMKVARTLHCGGYAGLPTAWPRLDAWVRSQGQIPMEELWEIYLAGPESDPDPKTWRTELNRPVTSI